MKILNVGFDNAVAQERVICVCHAQAAPIKRLTEAARKEHKLIDATNGRRTRTIIVMDSGHLIQSSIQAQTLLQRIEGQDPTLVKKRKNQ